MKWLSWHNNGCTRYNGNPWHINNGLQSPTYSSEVPTASDHSGIPESQERNRPEAYKLIQYITYLCKYIRSEIKKKSENQIIMEIV